MSRNATTSIVTDAKIDTVDDRSFFLPSHNYQNATYGGRHTVTLIPGHGLGPEMAIHVQNAFQELKVPINFDITQTSGSDDLDMQEIVLAIKRNGVALKGNLETKPGSISRNLLLRNSFDLYAYISRCYSFPGVNTRHKNIDIVVIRENTEGEYSRLEHESRKGVVESLKVITEAKSRRIAEFAFRFAIERNRKKVTCVHKANIMKLGDGLFLNTCTEVAKKYPQIEFDSMIVDNTCMQLVSKPEQFDVILLPNLYGSIVGSLCTGLVGGAGLTAGANIGDGLAMFEMGTRKTGRSLVGQNAANPIAMLMTSADMLDYLQLGRYAKVLRKAIFKATGKQNLLTVDLGGTSSTSEVMDGILANIAQSLKLIKTVVFLVATFVGFLGNAECLAMSRKTSRASENVTVRNALSVTGPPRDRESLSSESKKAPWIYTCESQLTCMALNQSRDRLLAVAGRNLLQILSVSSDGFQSIHSIKRHQPQGPKQSTVQTVPGPEELQSNIQLTKREPRSFYITTLTWGSSDELLFTGSTSGDVIVWNLEQGEITREINDTACFPGHSRTIHKIIMNPFKNYELATASQDGTIKLFDLREKDRANISFKTLLQKTAAASPVRDIAYYPRSDELLAAGQENGIVSLWDRRNPSKTLFSYPGHSCSINSIDWHPEGVGENKFWLATSGSRDFLIKVWDLAPGHMQQSGGFMSVRPLITSPSARLAHVIRTSRVNRIKWRPGSATLNQIASTSSTSLDLSLHVWDVNRPFVPFAIFEGHKDVIQAIAWDPHDSNILYTVAKDQLVFRHQFPDNAYFLYDEMPMATVSVSPLGSLVHSIVKVPTKEEFLHLELALQGEHIDSIDNSSSLFPPEVEVAKLSTSTFNSLDKDHRLPYFLALKSSVVHMLHYSPNSLNMVPDLLPNAMISLASNYWFMGSSPFEVCAHNAELCRQHNRPTLANFWKFIMFALPWSQIAKEAQKQMNESPRKSPDEDDFNYLPAFPSVPVTNLKLVSPFDQKPNKHFGKENQKFTSRKLSSQDRNKGVNLFMLEKLVSTPVDDPKPALPLEEEMTFVTKGRSTEGPTVSQIEAADYLFTGT
ncbi:Isocitrate dehydrogenase [NAD] subunit gamma 1, mitochondrial, partial [Cichlidogyrus casuarinus]